MAPTVATIIVSYNRSADLRLAIDSVRACGYPALRLVVVDNASRDDSLAVARSYPDVRVVANDENLGFAAAVNAGLERAEHEGAVDYAALLNNDAVLARDWIERLVEFLENHSDAAAVAGKIHFWDYDGPPGSQPSSYYGYSEVDPLTGYSTPRVDAPDQLREVVTLSGAAVMVRVKAIDAIGRPFLDPSFFLYYEETDFFARAIRKGWRLYYTGEPAAWHRVRGSSTSYVYHHYMERNRVLYAYRNFSDRGLRLAMRETMRRVKSAMTSPAELWRMARGEDEARARLDAWRWLVANRALLREQRRFVAGDAQPFEDVVAAVLSRASYYDHARPQLAALVPEGAKVVVDVGCGGGALGRALKRERPELRVFGMEPTEQADRAAEWLDGVSRNRAELGLPAEFPRPDVVIFADVLEHLPEPLEVLKVWRGAMAPGATLIVSLPNVGHVSVVAPLLRGSWRYVDAGVLDRTHLRFFTRDTALELVREAGFRISYAGRVADLERGLVSDAWRERLIRWTDGIAAEGVDALRGRFADLWTMQFLLVGKNDGAS